MSHMFNAPETVSSKIQKFYCGFFQNIQNISECLLLDIVIKVWIIKNTKVLNNFNEFLF